VVILSNKIKQKRLKKILLSPEHIVFKCINCKTYSRRPRQFGPGSFCEDMCRIEWESKSFGFSFDRNTYERIRYSKNRKKIMSAGDKIDRMAVFDYFNWKCHLCDIEIDKFLRTPHPLAATLDHKIPLAVGGTHTWNNVAPAHLKCNEIKGATYIDTAV
jgi:hypothetical protein